MTQSIHMTENPFDKYSLALFKDDEMIFSSRGTGLKPLVEAVSLFRYRYKDCILHDKVIGLAAARLIVFSGMIRSVISERSTEPAIKLLEDNYIKIDVNNIVNCILNEEKTGPCFMELKVREIEDDEGLFEHTKTMFGVD